jgi:hypothetical protein
VPQSNRLFYGDNLDMLRRYIKDESVNLVCLDPPFTSNQDYNVLFSERDGSLASAQIKACEDTMWLRITTTLRLKQVDGMAWITWRSREGQPGVRGDGHLAVLALQPRANAGSHRGWPRRTVQTGCRATVSAVGQPRGLMALGREEREQIW